MADPHQPVARRRSGSLGHRLFLVVTWIFKGLLRLGVPLGPMVLLTVRGRKSGQLRTTPVDLFEGNGHSFLVSTHRLESSNWVRNLRAAREGEVRRGHKHWKFTGARTSSRDRWQGAQRGLGATVGIASARIRSAAHFSSFS